MSVYYNEFDPHAAHWLRFLMLEGLIPFGDVDERSIIDVQPDDLKGYTQCHFFAGIGGWPYALHLAGWGDRPVWTGSCPCQPFSAAGKQKGNKDVRHLWPEFHRLIAQCRPPVVFGEQVASKLGREWLAGVFTDLEGVGYAVAGADLCAASVGAPHIRQRLWWVADSDCERRGSPDGGLGNAEHQGPQGQQRSSDLELHGEAGAVRPVAEASVSDAWSNCIRLPCADGGLGNAMQPGLAQRERDSGTRREAGCAPEGQAAELSSYWSDCIWLPCADGKARRIEPGIAPLAHGVSGRVAQLRGLGNAIVPTVAQAFIEAFLDTE